MSRQYALLAFAALAAPLAAPMAAAEPVRLVFRAAPGVAWQIERQQTNSADNPTTGPSGASSSTSATLKVIEAAGDGYVMEWTTTSVAGDATTADGVAPGVLEGMAIRFKAGPSGAPLELLNPDTVITGLLKAMSRRNVAPGSPALTAARKTFFAMAPADLARHVLADAANIASCQGLALEPGKPAASAAMSPPMANAAPMRLDVVTTLEDAGSAKSPARLRIVETPNQQDMVAGLLAGAKSRLRPGQTLPPDAEERIARMKQTTTIDCSVDRATGQALAVAIGLAIDTGSAAAGKISDVRTITLSRLP